MELHARHITGKIWILRTLFMVLLVICALAFSTEHDLAGYIAILLIFFGGFFRVNGLRIARRSVTVERSYFFGFIPVKWIKDPYTGGDIKLVNRTEHVTLTPSGTLADLVMIFIPGKAQLRGLVLRYSIAGGRERKLYASVTDKEYQLLSAYFAENNDEPSW